MSEATVIERRVDCESIGGIPLARLAERVGGTPFFAYDRRLLTERIGCCARRSRPGST